MVNKSNLIPKSGHEISSDSLLWVRTSTELDVERIADFTIDFLSQVSLICITTKLFIEISNLTVRLLPD
jgi:hypothetical protein